jgi:hypothetical protein
MDRVKNKKEKKTSKIIVSRDIGVVIAAVLIAIFFSITSPVFL